MRSSRWLFGLCISIAVALTPASPASTQEYQFPDDDIPGMKSPGMATTLSLLGTIVPIGTSFAFGEGQEGLASVLFLGGLLVGPSLGYFYAGEMGSAFKGIGLRTAVLGATVGLAAAVCSGGCDIVFGSDDGADAAVAILLGGLVATGILAGRDVARVDNSVRARNERIVRSAVSIGLQYVPEARAPGLVLTLRR
jgi:hypothetical protein